MLSTLRRGTSPAAPSWCTAATMAVPLVVTCGGLIPSQHRGQRCASVLAVATGPAHVRRRRPVGITSTTGSGCMAATRSRRACGTETCGSTREALGWLSFCMVDHVAGEHMLLCGIQTQRLSGCMVAQQVPNSFRTCGSSSPQGKSGKK